MSLKIFNAFGIKPTNTAKSAGMDFYIPDLRKISRDMKDEAVAALCKSYGVMPEELSVIYGTLTKAIGLLYPEDTARYAVYGENLQNLVLLYLALDSATVKQAVKDGGTAYGVTRFMTDYAAKDDAGRVGVKMKQGDSLFVNSGIRVALPADTAGIFDNKSGLGRKGWAIRAKVVDEDYTGYVHLNAAFTKDPVDGKNVIYCGDKFVQMIIFDVRHMEPEEVTADEYDRLMAGSERGDGAFGHNDVKH